MSELVNGYGRSMWEGDVSTGLVRSQVVQHDKKFQEALEREHPHKKGVVCPCCGAPVPGLPVTGLEHVPLTGQQRLIMNAMVRAYPRVVPLTHLVDAVWGHRPDGGPDGDVLNQLAVQQVKINKVIRPLGWQMSAAYNGKTGSRRLLQVITSRPDKRATNSGRRGR